MPVRRVTASARAYPLEPLPSFQAKFRAFVAGRNLGQLNGSVFEEKVGRGRGWREALHLAVNFTGVSRQQGSDVGFAADI